eukprot:TRINITY_DN3019_c0_g1_i4.p1 TRINITY_DN3019_c0_g1~~TRINITY_DN3019_c0_g1_i4.p1  ORF type:complete len:1534 (-),score=241.49 TRINITY_DN3019_c0_g1_i4:118-4719(-)
MKGLLFVVAPLLVACDVSCSEITEVCPQSKKPNATKSAALLQLVALTNKDWTASTCYGELSAVAMEEGAGIGDKIETLSLQDCQRSCTDEPQCQSFAFCPHFEGCWLKEKSMSAGEPTKDFFDCKTYFKTPCGTTPPPSPTPSPPGSMGLLSWDAAYAKASAMVARMNSAEKYSMMKGLEEAWPNHQFTWPYYVGNTAAIPRLGIPSLNMFDAGNGFSTKYDELIGTVTCWPSQLALAASWDTQLVSEVASAIAEEFLGKGANVLLGPSINVHRVARNGRNFEYLSGEDPYLGARLVEAYLKGVHSHSGIIAVVKHAFLNHQETNRHKVSMSVDDKTLWELYYPPWKAAVNAGVGSVMCAYNKIDGIYSCSNAQRLKSDLKGTMGFRGFVMSDWWATEDNSVEEGLDQMQPGSMDGDLFSPGALASIRSGAIDESVVRILASMYRHDLFSKSWCIPASSDCANLLRQNVATPAHALQAEKAATESIVLLQNKGSVLPISRSVKTIAIVGKAAAAGTRPRGSAWNVGDYYSGGGSGHLTAAEVVTPLQGLRERALALGMTVVSDTSGSAASATEKAREADLTIVVAATTCGEDNDRPNLLLDDDVETLISSVAATNVPTIVVVQAPGTVLMPWRDEVDGIAIMFLGGQSTGAAWANILFGDAVPVGRLPLVIPQSEDDTIKPDQDLSVKYTEGMSTSYRRPNAIPAYPFGHGLTYTNFKYGKPRSSLCEEDWCVDLEIENVGQVAAPEVVQLYLELPSEAGWPTPLLKGFQKTATLSPGSSETVSFRLTGEDRSYYADLPGASWMQVAKEACIAHIGASSTDIRHTIQGSEVSTVPSTTTSTTAPIARLFSPVDGGSGRACRGEGGQDSATFYSIQSAGSLGDCKDLCAAVTGCRGIEWNPNGRCEVWTTAVATSKAAAGYTCLRTSASPGTTLSPRTGSIFLPVDGGVDRACRGESGQNLATFYTIQSAGSIDACKALCDAVQECKGIEWNPNGRCEIWTSTIAATKVAVGYTCMLVETRTSQSPGRTSSTVTTSAAPEISSKDCCKDFSVWPNVDNGVTCGRCTALVLTAPYSGRCDKYCESFGLTCTSAAEEENDNCEVKYTARCDEEISGTSDMLCQCNALPVSQECTRADTTPFPQPSTTRVPLSAAWFGVGKVTDPAFWETMRGIGFSPTDHRGSEWFMSRDNPSMARLDDALTKLVTNGFTMIRTWRTGTYEEKVLERIRARNLNIKVQFGVDIDNDGHAEQLIDTAVQVASKYPEHTLGLSVGNERIGLTRQLTAQQVLRHAQYAKREYGIPVTYNFFEYTIPSMSNQDLDLVRGLDYINVHLYGHHHGERYDGSWTPQKQLLAVRDEQTELLSKLGAINKCIIIGETGWQSRGYAASSVSKAQEYYIAITRHVYSKGPDSPALSMFYFNLNDEAWKGGDDAWGLYVQGDGERIGETGTGNAKFPVTKVSDILNPSQNVYEKSSLAGGWGGWCTCPDGQRYNVGDRLDGCQHGPASLACEGGVPEECNKVEEAQRTGMMVTCSRPA